MLCADGDIRVCVICSLIGYAMLGIPFYLANYRKEKKFEHSRNKWSGIR